MSDSTRDVAALRSRLAALHLSQRGLARALGVNERTVRDWASGETPVPGHVWRWLDDAIAPPPAGTTDDDDRDDECADAVEPHMARLLSRATTAGWSEAEIVTAMLSLVTSEMRKRAGDRATRETLAQVIMQLDD